MTTIERDKQGGRRPAYLIALAMVLLSLTRAKNLVRPPRTSELPFACSVSCRLRGSALMVLLNC